MTKETKKSIQLVIIDAQNDFCDLPDDYCPIIAGTPYRPTLPVAGAHADCLKIAALIDQAASKITAIDAFMDTHQYMDMGHMSAWMMASGEPLTHPTPITLLDVAAGRVVHRIPGGAQKMLTYLGYVDSVFAWPVHCQIGTYGHAIHADIMRACSQWEQEQLSFVNYEQKGTDPWSEHYSALQAEVVDSRNPLTMLNNAAINRYKQADMTIFVGEASSHCVRKTIWHAVAALHPEERQKLVILIDCMSAIPGFEEGTNAFFKDMALLGARVMTSEDLLHELNESAQALSQATLSN